MKSDEPTCYAPHRGGSRHRPTGSGVAARAGDDGPSATPGSRPSGGGRFHPYAVRLAPGDSDTRDGPAGPNVAYRPCTGHATARRHPLSLARGDARGTGMRPARVDPLTRQRLLPAIQQVAVTYQLEPALLHAVISAESGYNPQALSKKGARGLMQLMPATARRLGVSDPDDPTDNLQGGARYLRWLLDRFTDLRLALAAYNAGEGAVQRYGNTLPPYPETRTYVRRVLDFYDDYRRKAVR
ncbi:MAG: lytic transglycosylase domain-containing protein [Candidatus Competibacteraceae bacterium]